MYNRLIKLPKNRSFFLFGQRGTGKSTLLRTQLKDSALEISLLDSKLFYQLSSAPAELHSLVLGRKPKQNIVVIDEIQKVPALLDEVHRLIEDHGVVFALTGSSARKLKKSGVNLLAGRAFDFRLYPLASEELGDDFNLSHALQWGTLPAVLNAQSAQDKEEYLYAYVNTYLREEIILEQVVRQIEPFGRFLEVAAQSHGEVISFANIAKDVGISAVSAKTYFEILCDTLIGTFLRPYHRTIRKKQKQAPKFYFYDNGLVRALKRRAAIEPHPESPEFGRLFESFVINEIIRLNEYRRSRFQLSHLRIDHKDEVDLIVERPGLETLAIEIKSKSTAIGEDDTATLNRLGSSIKGSRLYCISRVPQRKKIGNVLCLPWQDGLKEIFNV